MQTSTGDETGERIVALLATAAITPTGGVPPSPARRRGREIVVLREDGFSLSEIAEHYGVSRERVRQILRANGGPASADAVRARRRREERAVEERIGDLLARWRSGAPLGEIAAELGMQAAMCSTMVARFATDVDRAARRASIARSRGRARTYSDRDILDALVVVARRLGEVPAPRQYAELAPQLRLPSLATVLNRMGGWTSAVRAAGMQPRAGARAARARLWTEDECWRALWRAVGALGDIPTVRAYDAFAAGRDDIPSSATIRKRLGRWSAISAQLAVARA